MKKGNLIFILFLVGGCSGGENTLSISSGFFHSCRIEKWEDGNRLLCWGRNIEGELGKGDYLPSPGYIYTNEEIRIEGIWDSVYSVSTGGYHTCGIDGDNKLWCWGRNDYGQVGDGENENKNLPQMISDKKWKSVSAGGYHTCGIDDDNKLWCWGRNDYGQVGDGGNENKNLPLMVSDKKWKSVSAGGYHTCAIDDGNKLWCWGRNDYGQVGDGENENKNLPQMISDKKWKSVSAGGYHTCGIDDGNKLWCWGRNDYGQVGDGENENKNLPLMISNKKWKSVSAGGYHTCGIDDDNKLWCWGRNDYGQVGDESFGNRNMPVMVSPRGVKDKWILISAGGYHTCGVIEEKRKVYCWGSDAYGQLGVNPLKREPYFGWNNPITSPVQIGNDKDWTFVSTSLVTNCAIKDDGSLWCWGSGLCNPSPFPKRIGNDNDWAYVLANFFEIYGIKKDRTLWRSTLKIEDQRDPYNPDIMMKISCIDDYSPFTKVGEEKDWIAVYGGVMGSVISMKEDGSIYGISGNKIEKISDERWRLLSNGSAEYSGIINKYGIKEDGTLWGLNYTYNSGPSEIPVGNENDWEFVDMNYAIKKDGSLWRLEKDPNNFGNWDKYIIPSKMDEEKWKEVSSGEFGFLSLFYAHSCAIKEDGTLWCWVTRNDEIVQPITRVSNDRWISVSNRTFLFGITCGIKEDKTLWCWGSDFHGSLGIGPPEEE